MSHSRSEHSSEDSILHSLGNLRDSIASLGNEARDELSQAMSVSEIKGLALRDIAPEDFGNNPPEGNALVPAGQELFQPLPKGGRKVINFMQQDDNDWQPEACRMMFGALSKAAKLADMPEKTLVPNRNRKSSSDPEFVNEKVLEKVTKCEGGIGRRTDRHIIINVPDDKAEEFDQALRQVSAKIKSSGAALVGQYESAMNLALHSVNHIPGAKPFFNLEGPIHGTRPLSVEILIQNTPQELADKLSGIPGVEIGRVSSATTSRDRKTEFPGGGRDVQINVGSSGYDEAEQIIQAYARKLRAGRIEDAFPDVKRIDGVEPNPEDKDVPKLEDGHHNPPKKRGGGGFLGWIGWKGNAKQGPYEGPSM